MVSFLKSKNATVSVPRIPWPRPARPPERLPTRLADHTLPLTPPGERTQPGRSAPPCLPEAVCLQNRKQLLLPRRRDWAGQGAAADGGGGAGATAGWRGKASVLILAIGARAWEPVGVAAA